MRLQLIRSATLRLTYADREILIDPYLAPKHSRPSYSGKSPNPLVELKCPPEQVISGTELVIISHLHSDHFEETAARLLPRTTPIFCQAEETAALAAMGFTQVTGINNALCWQGITITRRPGRHGEGPVGKEMGLVSGFVFQAPSEPTLYWAGDTVLCPEVLAAVQQYAPAIIVTHSCGAMWQGQGPIVMDAAQTVDLCRQAPGSTVIATHLDSVDHATVTRAALRQYAREQGIAPDRLLIPEDMEAFVF